MIITSDSIRAIFTIFNPKKEKINQHAENIICSIEKPYKPLIVSNNAGNFLIMLNCFFDKIRKLIKIFIDKIRNLNFLKLQ